MMVVVVIMIIHAVCLTSSFVIAVLQSVFPQAELGNFRVALKRDQEQQLKELTMIVTGIRLFNKANKRGEEEVDIHELSTVFMLIFHFASLRLIVRRPLL